MSSDHRLQRIEKQIEAMHKKQIPSFQPVVPDILEFTTSDAYLGRPGLFPRQATILKLLFLQDALFTDYDLEVISQWTSSFERTGNNGVQPDVLERLRICKAEGRHYFKETLAVIGRRGGKNHLGAIAAPYVTWRFLALGDPQSFYGLDDGQRLSMFVFAGNHLQAKHNQFREIARFIGEARCFKPFLADKTGARLTLYTPKDLELGGAEVRAGSKLWGRQPSIEIVAKESTAISGRGPTAYGELFDEMAHTVASGSNRSAEEIYDAATPALDQFGKDGFLFEPSSPYHSTGKFFENYRRALDVTDDGKPTNPHMLMFQLTSFDPYIDWERAHELPMVPNGPAFQRLERAPQTFDKEMEGLREANPETFEVERLSRFATVRDAYLAENKVAAMFGPWRGSPLLMLSRGVPIHTYWAHCDTSQSNANTARAIGHGEEVDGVVHVVIDRLQLWRPQDFPEHQINYRELEEELWQALVAFTPAELSFDQFQSASLISSLSDRVAKDEFSEGCKCAP